MTKPVYGRPRRLLPLLVLVAAGSLLPWLAGCHREQRGHAPNEATAAPAVLPGEDPHAGPGAPGSRPAGLKK